MMLYHFMERENLGLGNNSGCSPVCMGFAFDVLSFALIYLRSRRNAVTYEESYNS